MFADLYNHLYLAFYGPQAEVCFAHQEVFLLLLWLPVCTEPYSGSGQWVATLLYLSRTLVCILYEVTCLLC